MLTLRDLDFANRFLNKHYALPYYSAQKNKLANKLCRMSRGERGDKIEAMVLGLFIRCGYNVHKMGGLKNKCDIWVNDEKIEIKSSLAERNTNKKGEEYYSYTFAGVKPDCFDRLVLAYVKPNGVELRILTKRAVYARIRKNNLSKSGSQGCSLYHGKNDKMMGRPFYDFLELTTR